MASAFHFDSTMSATLTAKIQMFRLNELGDCFLVTFTDGTQSSRLLIDCGSFRNSGPSINRIKEIAGLIDSAVAGQGLDVVVGTHQHNDHVSGFVHAEAEFRKIGIGQVWLSWLDDPSDASAQSIGNDHHNLRTNLANARDALVGQPNVSRRPVLARSQMVLEDILGFYGADAAGTPPDLPAKGMENLKKLGKQPPRFLSPGQTLTMPGFDESSLKVHVLGPPRNTDLLYRKDPKKGESYDHALAAANLQAARFFSAVSGTESDDEKHYPFSSRYKVKPGDASSSLAKIIRDYEKKDAWRRIDDDWLMQAESLALYLDSYTNNSSLVLAIEMVESRKVLLFAADAQIGNWVSWDSVVWDDPKVATNDLMSRTVFYKVGHHGSSNATLPAAFEKMNHPDLVAFVPVNKKDSNITKPNGWKMPAAGLFRRIKEKTANRVLQMDNDNPPDCDPKKTTVKAVWKKAGITPVISDDVIEITIS